MYQASYIDGISNDLFKNSNNEGERVSICKSIFIYIFLLS